MAIKMRYNREEDACCCDCGETQNEVLNMYDICIGGTILTICDRCAEQIMNKTLKAVVDRNHRVKSSRDIAIIRRRGREDYETRRWERYAAGTQTKPYEPLTKKGKEK